MYTNSQQPALYRLAVVEREKIMRIFRKLMVFCLCAALLFSSTVKPVSASEKSDGYNMSQVLKYYGQKKYKKAQRYNKKLSKYAKESCVQSMTPGMKKEYLKIVKKHNKDAKEPAIDYHVMAYYLTDIDNDGNAELIVKAGETIADAKFYIYRYKDGAAKKIGTFGAYHLDAYAYPQHQGVIFYGGVWQSEDITLTTIKNKKLHNVRIGTREHTTSFFYLRCALESHVHYNKKLKLIVDYSPLQ